MSNQLERKNEPSEVISKLVLSGDLSKMTDSQKVSYYTQFCESLGLNPLTEPFAILTLNGKQKLYAKKDATEQLRKVHGVSIESLECEEIKGCYRVIAKAKDGKGKTDVSTGIVSIEGLKGENLANAMMKAETKAKRRVTLSICGLGMLDETEIETIQDAVIVQPAEITTWQPTAEEMQELSDLVDNSTLEDKRKQDARIAVTNCKTQKEVDKIKAALLKSQSNG
jgi:hypothetical protein